MTRELADRRKAQRRQSVTEALEGYEACRRREERRKSLDNVRVAHWIDLFWQERVRNANGIMGN